MPAPMSDAELDTLAKELVDWYIRWNPSFATHVGVHEYDHLMPRGTYEAELEERSHVKGFLRRLEGIDRKTLSPSKRVDYGVLRNSFRLWIFESDELAIWQAMPNAASGIGDSLFPLFMREFAPLPQRLESISARLEKSPAFLEESKGRVRSPVKLWSEIGLESAQRLPGFLRAIEGAGSGVLAGPDRARLAEAVAKANDALQAYAGWVEKQVLPQAEERIGIGARVPATARACGTSWRRCRSATPGTPPSP